MQYGRLLLVLSCFHASAAFAVEITETRRLTSDAADQYNPVISGSFVVYTDTRAGNADIYLFNLASGAEVNITNDPANQLLNDVQGDFVVYSDYRTGVPQVWAYHIPSGIPCQLTHATTPQLSPSIGGELVVFQNTNGAESHVGFFDLSVFDTDHFEASCAQPHSDGLLPLGPGKQLLPRTSGNWVVYQETTASGPRVFGFNRQTQQIVAVPEHGKNQLLPDIDGARIAYVEDDLVVRDIVYYDFETSTFVQVTNDASRQNYPSISGNLVAFEDDRNGNLDIFIYDLTTGLLTQLTDDPANQYLNSLDHTHVAFTDASAGNLDVVMIAFNPQAPPVPEPCQRQTGGSAPVALTMSQVQHEQVHWPWLSVSAVGGSGDTVSDRSRITYNVNVTRDVPQAQLSLRVKLPRSPLPAILRAAGADAAAGVVLRLNGSELRWADADAGKTTIVAEKRYAPAAWTDGEAVFSEAKSFLLPPWIQVTAGRSGVDWLTLTYDDNKCRYLGIGKRYYFVWCDSGRFAGQSVTASRVGIHVNDGDSHDAAGRTEVTARLYGDPAWGDDSDREIPLPSQVALFAGDNTLSAEGFGYGSTYWKYRPVEIVSLSATARAECVADPSLIPECHAAGAVTLAGPVTFVRHAGPIEIQTLSYDASGPVVVCVQNGDGDGTKRVVSAVVSHNGSPVLGPAAFGVTVAETAAPAQALASNTLGVQLQSAPGSFLTVRVIQGAAAAGATGPTSPPSTPPTVTVHPGCSSLPNAGATQLFSLLLPLCSLWCLRSWRLRLARSKSTFRKS